MRQAASNTPSILLRSLWSPSFRYPVGGRQPSLKGRAAQQGAQAGGALLSSRTARELRSLAPVLGERRGEAVTDEEHFAEWQRYIKATYRETVDAFWNRKLYRAVRQMFRTNPDLAASGQHIWEWIAGMYARDAAMLVRRELDRQKGVLNLRHLLYDMEEHVDVLASRRNATYLPTAEVIQRDRELLEKETSKVRAYAERLLAHRTDTVDLDVTFAEVDHAVKAVLHTMRRYYGYLTGSDLLVATPVARFDWLAPFSFPWISEAFHEPDDDEELEV